MKRLLSLLLVLALLFCVLPAQAFSAEETDPATDSDYDGIPDAADPHPDSNVFTGAYKSGDFKISVEYVMDYRNFFGDNKAYNPEIADFSTWAAQLTYENDDSKTTYTPADQLKDYDGSDIGTVYHIDQLMRAHGMENVIDYTLKDGYSDDAITLEAYSDDDISEAYFGHHKVSFDGQTIEVVAVYVRGTNGTEEEWCSNFDVGDLNRFGDEYDCVEGKSPRQKNADWTRKSNHRGFDVCSTRIRRALKTYMEQYVDSDVRPVFWISGHSRGGAISNITASYLIDEGYKVFAYTFAAPNTTANTEASAEKYDCIFNLVNGDDFVPRLPMPAWGFTRYGKTATVFASSATSTQRSSYIGKTGYTYASDSDLSSLVNKFAVMTKNNEGVIEGWRDVYVYHCHGGDDVDHDEMHEHAGETIGEFRRATRMDFGTNSNWNGYNEHTKKFSYCVKDKDGGFLGLGNKWSCCQTPAYAMQILAITMGNLGLSAGWDFLTSYKLADQFDFGKTSLITNYATKIIDPHYMENYYLIQRLISDPAGSDPGALFTTGGSLYTDGSGRPAHTHDYVLHCYEGQEPTCTEKGKGYMVCTCSAVNPDWYDDVVQDVEIPALDHDFTCAYSGYFGNYCHTFTCQRCGSQVTEPCVYKGSDVCTVCGHEKREPQWVEIYVVDETDSERVRYWFWGNEPRLDDLAEPGPEAACLGTDFNGHRYYVFSLDAANYGDGIYLATDTGAENRTADLDYVSHLTISERGAYCVVYLSREEGVLIASFDENDVWPKDPDHMTSTDPSCEASGMTVYVGLLTGEEKTVPGAPALGHDWSDWNETEAPSCTQTGLRFHTCARCGYEASEVLPELGHDWDEGVVTTPPTESSGGVKTYTCLRCGQTRTETILALSFRFDDVMDPRKFYYVPVYWAYFHNPQITTGTSARLFSPGKSCTRAQVVTFLWRAVGAPEPELDSCAFTDVKKGAFYYKAMLWALETGVTTGTGSTTFSPNREATRAQVVTFLWRAMGKPEPRKRTHSFLDVQEGAYYYEAMLWAVESGITTGISSRAFGPKVTATRGHIVTFLFRALAEEQE